MTTEQTMLTRTRACLVCAVVLTIAALCGGLAGCAAKDDILVAPQTIAAPYDTSGGDILWAVVPLRNESGTSIVDPLEVSDKVVQAAAEVHGIHALPLNRTIAAMHALKMSELQSPADAKKLASELGVDGLLVGSITAWDPYNPPKCGLALALYSRPGAMSRRGPQTIDTRKLESAPTDYQYFPRSSYESAPASVVSEILDGKNQQVLMDVKSYASGRSDPMTALGWRKYVASMDLFSEFAAWHGVRRLLDQEWLRLARDQARAGTKN